VNVKTLEWIGGRPGHVRLIDQTRLPGEHILVEVRDAEAMHDCIRRLVVRGAPAIGVAAAFGLLLGVQSLEERDREDVVGRVRECAAFLATARPTAVNLFWALERMCARATRDYNAARPIVDGLFEEARLIYEQDREICRRIGAIGAELLRDGSTVLTHCNAGALATADYGTALAPIYVAKDQGKRVAVYADETRPLLQGARLTAWELTQAGIDVTLITDSMAGRVLFEGKIDAVFVGADRIARNGDSANKIGTYAVAILCKHHGIPFYVAAPTSTVDLGCASGEDIPIEERRADEVTAPQGVRFAAAGIDVFNPAFDVAPASLITAIITEEGVARPPFTADLQRMVAAAQRRRSVKA
jgi:methylthioribose-1-phosphate isomerase